MGMERLWAPWRMEYVKQVDKGDGCFLCRAAASKDDRADMVLWRSERSFAMLNLWPYNNGHILVAHREHKADLAEMTDAELLDQVRLLKRCQRNLQAVMSPDGFNVGLNLGRSAGAGVVDHAHWHIVPRWQGDSNFMPVTASTKVIPQSLDRLWELLREVDGGS